jgi:hypothetical protein
VALFFLEKSPERDKSSRLHRPSSPGRVTRPLEAAVVSEILDFRRGYRDFLEAITDPNQQEHAEKLEWIGHDFDSKSTDVEALTPGRARPRKEVEPQVIIP